MRLNTKDLLSSPNEETITSGITYHRIVTPSEWGDLTANRSLYGYEVDRNFYNLKAQDIKTAYAEGNSIYLVKWNGDKYKIDVERLSELAKEIEDANGRIDELSGVTLDFIEQVEGEYCTKEEAKEIAEEAADVIREEVKEAEYLTETDLLSWMMNNLKTINCISLIGKGNICLDCCGGSTLKLLSGDAINIVTDKTDSSMTVNVVVESGETETEESKHDDEKPGKNFLKIKKEGDKSWLQVDGVDSDSIYITEDIKLGGTRLGDFAKADSFPDGYIPKGMTLQSVLEKLFWGEQTETWDELAISYLLQFVTYSKITVTATDANGNDVTNKTVAKGSKVKFNITRVKGSGSQNSKVSGFSNGYKIGDETYTGSIYSLSGNPTVEEGELSNAITGDMQPVEGEENTYIIGSEKSTFKASAVDTLKHSYFDPVKVYDISSKGNTSEEHTATLVESAAGLNDITYAFSGLCYVDSVVPFYYGFMPTAHDFDEEGVDHGAYISSTFNACLSAISYDTDWFILDIAAGSKQVLVSVPSSNVSSMIIKNAFGSNIYNTEDTRHISINGDDYLTWFYTASVRYPQTSYKITFVK